MLIFHLKKKWFDLIKQGKKTHEYRELTPYWFERIEKLKLAMKENTIVIALCSGYPAQKEFETKSKRIVYAELKNISVVDGKNTDLKIDRKVFDIELKLLEE